MNTQRDLEKEHYITEYEGLCGTCHYWTKDGKEHSCMCFSSPFAADWTDEDDSCGYYTARRSIHYL